MIRLTCVVCVVVVFRDFSPETDLGPSPETDAQ